MNKELSILIETECPSHNAKLLLIALASHTNRKKGWIAYPGQKRLAKEAQLSERTVRKELAALERAGLIVRKRRHRADGSRTSDTYQIMPLANRQDLPVDDANRQDLPVVSAQDIENTEEKSYRQSMPLAQFAGSENEAYRQKLPNLPANCAGQYNHYGLPELPKWNVREDARERVPARPLDEAGIRPDDLDRETKTSSSFGAKPTTPKTQSQAKPKKPTPRQVLEAALRPQDAADVVEHRQRLRKPLTARAAQALAREFGKLPVEQRPEAVEVMLMKGWQGFRAEWFENAMSDCSGVAGGAVKASPGSSGGWRHDAAGAVFERFVNSDGKPCSVEVRRELYQLAVKHLKGAWGGDWTAAEHALDAHAEDLADIPQEAVVAALKEIRRSSRWWPDVAAIVEVVQPHMDRAMDEERRDFEARLRSRIRGAEGLELVTIDGGKK